MTSCPILKVRMNTLLVFDYATTGSEPTRDRPVEFACVRLDMDLKIVGSPTNLHCKPSPDICRTLLHRS
jgi:exodeoxyribonuclease-1